MLSKMSIAVGVLTTLATVAAPTHTPPQSPVGLHGTENLPSGFLTRDQLPNSLELLPPPPVDGSPDFARDQAGAERARSLEGTPRWQIAAKDADLSFPQAPANFSCAAGVNIGSEATPLTFRLLARSGVDIGLSTYRAKDQYRRTRPFVQNGLATCFPKDEAKLRQDGSYPSGHSAVGWGWALILAELVPDRGDAIFQRGREYGQSRVVCGAHWQSDVEAGRLVAAATVARLHADAEFRQALNAARREINAIRSKPLPDQGACAAEIAALTLRPTK